MSTSSVKLKHCIRRDSGAAILEFAIIAPVLIIVLAGVIDFGLYYMRGQTVNRAVANIAHALTLDPADQSIGQLRYQEGLGLADLGSGNTGSNYLCAMSYATQALAEQGGCDGQAWDTMPPAPGVSEYYVAINAHVTEASVTGIFSDILPQINVKNVVRITDIPQQITNIENQLGSTNTNLNNTNSTLNDTKNTLSNVNNQVTNLGNSLTNTTSTIQSTINNINNSVTNHQTQTNTKITELEQTIQKITNSLNFTEKETVDANRCRVETTMNGNASVLGGSYVSTVECASDEMALSIGAHSEVPGAAGICSGVNMSFVHTMIPTASGNGVWADSYRTDLGGEACVKAYVVCCKKMRVLAVK